MRAVKVARDALFASFLVAMLIIMSWATPFGFIGPQILTAFGLFLLFIHVFVEATFLKL